MCLDGPEMPTIMGPNVAKAGDNITLSCNASSNPPSTYKWFFSDSQVDNYTSEYIPAATTSELEIGPLTLNMSGMYTCMAFNNITGKNSSAYTVLTVIGEMNIKGCFYVCAKMHLCTNLDFLFIYRFNKGSSSRCAHVSCYRRSFLQAYMQCDWTC